MIHRLTSKAFKLFSRKRAARRAAIFRCSSAPVRRRHLSVFILLAPVFVRACVSIRREHARVCVQCQQTDVVVTTLGLSLSLVVPRVHRGSVIRRRRALKGILQLCTEAKIKTREVASTCSPPPPRFYRTIARQFPSDA